MGPSSDLPSISFVSHGVDIWNETCAHVPRFGSKNVTFPLLSKATNKALNVYQSLTNTNTRMSMSHVRLSTTSPTT
ncbi:hypothetical protein LSAT2_019768 [Lamellibrachia satsuma]|nr:hypothetical protein LSAT2_019768 [Lamellibrachia satsuma]